MNEKQTAGKKKFNIVDFAILAIIIILIAAVLWQLTTATDEAEATAAAQEEVQIYEDAPHMRCTVECTKVPVAAAEVMVRNEDPQLNNNYTDLAAYIVDVTTRPTSHQEIDADGNVIEVVDPSTCTVVFVIEAFYNEAEATEKMAFSIGPQELRIGKSYNVKTKSIEQNGTVVAMEVVYE